MGNECCQGREKDKFPSPDSKSINSNTLLQTETEPDNRSLLENPFTGPQIIKEPPEQSFKNKTSQDKILSSRSFNRDIHSKQDDMISKAPSKGGKKKKSTSQNKKSSIINKKVNIQNNKKSTSFNDNTHKDPIKKNIPINTDIHEISSFHSRKTNVEDKGRGLQSNETSIGTKRKNCELYITIKCLNMVCDTLYFFGEKEAIIPVLELNIINKGGDKQLSLIQEGVFDSNYDSTKRDDETFAKNFVYFYTTKVLSEESISSYENTTSNDIVIAKYSYKIDFEYKVTQEDMATNNSLLVIEVYNKLNADMMKINIGSTKINISSIIKEISNSNKDSFTGYLQLVSAYCKVIGYGEISILTEQPQQQEDEEEEESIETPKEKKSKRNEHISTGESCTIFPIYNDLDLLQSLSDTSLKHLNPKLQRDSLPEPVIIYDKEEGFNPIDLYEKFKEALKKKDLINIYYFLIYINQLNDTSYKHFIEFLKQFNKKKDKLTFYSSVIIQSQNNIFICTLLFRFLYHYLGFCSNNYDFSIRQNCSIDILDLIKQIISFINDVVKKVNDGREIEEFKVKNEECIIYCLNILIDICSEKQNSNPSNGSLLNINDQKKTEQVLKYKACKILFQSLDSIVAIIADKSFFISNSYIAMSTSILLRRVIATLNNESLFLDIKDRNFFKEDIKIQIAEKLNKAKQGIEAYRHYPYIIYNFQFIYYIISEVSQDKIVGLCKILIQEGLYSIFTSDYNYKGRFSNNGFKIMNNNTIGFTRNILCNSGKYCKGIGILVEDGTKNYYGQEENFNNFMKEKQNNFELHYLICEIAVVITKYNELKNIFLNVKNLNIDIIKYFELIASGDYDDKESTYIYKMNKLRGKSSTKKEIAKISMFILERSMLIWIQENSISTEGGDELLNYFGSFGCVESFIEHLSMFLRYLSMFDIEDEDATNYLKEGSDQLDQ